MKNVMGATEEYMNVIQFYHLKIGVILVCMEKKNLIMICNECNKETLDKNLTLYITQGFICRDCDQ